ncbi:hypothetical protein K2Y11_04215 [bacterium]|nr:hypothetical protein [bacterium]
MIERLKRVTRCALLTFFGVMAVSPERSLAIVLIPTYKAETSATFANLFDQDSQFALTDSARSLSLVDDSPSNDGYAYAVAWPGHLTSHTAVFKDKSTTVSFEAIAKATLFLNDLSINSDQSVVSTRLNLNLTGVFRNGLLSGQAYEEMEVTYSLAQGGTHTSGSGNAVFDGSLTSSGIVQGFSNGFGVAISTAPITIDATIPFSLLLTLQTKVSGNLASNEKGYVEADFGHSLTFATDRPVFENLSGASVFTVNSAQGGIVDNSYSVIPESSSLLMASVGSVCLLLLQLRLSIRRLRPIASNCSRRIA